VGQSEIPVSRDMLGPEDLGDCPEFLQQITPPRGRTYEDVIADKLSCGKVVLVAGTTQLGVEDCTVGVISIIKQKKRGGKVTVSGWTLHIGHAGPEELTVRHFDTRKKSTLAHPLPSSETHFVAEVTDARFAHRNCNADDLVFILRYAAQFIPDSTADEHAD